MVRAALAHKNDLFAGSDAGGERAAITHTLLCGCRLVGLDPTEYLADVPQVVILAVGEF